MRTAVEEFSTIDIRFGSLDERPVRMARPARGDVDRADSRRPRGVRPSGVAGYDRVSVTRLPRGPHPVQRVQRARANLATLAATALFTAAAVCALIGIAHVRSVPPAAATQTVQVRPGESLSEVAQRVAPADPVRDTVARIVELNGLRGAAVAGGRTLLVPAAR
ncbi:LysM peptidoglycan-binding domain-containing protein [Nocardia sp. NPDC052254]|uniref:LysM peptidoglycan-binding domain-containing protein n=1 Tax=Nocardia sp. NPDC052254 TaxID=3155681 RepID=UPI0034271600